MKVRSRHGGAQAAEVVRTPLTAREGAGVVSARTATRLGRRKENDGKSRPIASQRWGRCMSGSAAVGCAGRGRYSKYPTARPAGMGPPHILPRTPPRGRPHHPGNPLHKGRLKAHRLQGNGGEARGKPKAKKTAKTRARSGIGGGTAVHRPGIPLAERPSLGGGRAGLKERLRPRPNTTGIGPGRPPADAMSAARRRNRYRRQRQSERGGGRGRRATGVGDRRQAPGGQGSGRRQQQRTGLPQTGACKEPTVTGMVNNPPAQRPCWRGGWLFDPRPECQKAPSWRRSRQPLSSVWSQSLRPLTVAEEHDER